MKKVLAIAAIDAVLSALIWAVVNKDSYSWRQKLTITVETPAGEVQAPQSARSVGASNGSVGMAWAGTMT